MEFANDTVRRELEHQLVTPPPTGAPRPVHTRTHTLFVGESVLSQSVSQSASQSGAPRPVHTRTHTLFVGQSLSQAVSQSVRRWAGGVCCWKAYTLTCVSLGMESRTGLLRSPAQIHDLVVQCKFKAMTAVCNICACNNHHCETENSVGFDGSLPLFQILFFQY